MSTNTFPRQIEPEEIREGDLIRAEHGDQAREGRVRFVGERPPLGVLFSINYLRDRGWKFFLLDRPEPPRPPAMDAELDSLWEHPDGTRYRCYHVSSDQQRRFIRLSSGGVIGDLFLSGHGDAKRIAELTPVVERTWQDAIDALRTAAAGFPSGTRGRADMREVADYLESLAAAEGRGERS